MAIHRRTIAFMVPVALATIGALAQPAAASHMGVEADCGAAGTLTLRATPNAAGFQSPAVFNVLLFEEGGTLTQLKRVVNGIVMWDAAAVGRMANAVDEVTCSFTIGNGDGSRSRAS